MIISTIQFGDLEFDPDSECFTGIAQWNNQQIRIDFPVDQKEIEDIALATAQTLWLGQDQWQQSIQTLVSSLVEIKNDAWLEDDEDELTAAEFYDRITMETTSISADGSFEFWYDDGELFWRNSIVVRGNLERGLIEACTEG
jgi:hypothetical protein